MSERTEALARWRRYVDIICYRATSELRAEASRTYAGYLWWVLLPLLSLGTYYIAFEHILDRGGKGFVMFLFSGIIFWQWFQMSVVRCSGSLIASRGLMQQVHLHKTVFPLSVILVNLFKFSITLALLLVALVLFGHTPNLAWLSLLPLLLTEILVIIAFGCAAASISPFLPDFQLILGTVLHLAFFVSGIFFNVSTLSPRLQSYLRFNPLAVLINQYRRVLLEGQWLQWSELSIPVAEAVLVLALAFGMLHRYNKVYAKLG